ncbi:MAG: calcium-binding protein [Pseudomonadota bacterium]
MLDATISTLLISYDDSDSFRDRVAELFDVDIENPPSLDFEDELDAFLNDETALGAAFDSTPTLVTDTQIVWGDSLNGASLNGLSLSGLSSLDAFFEALSNSLGTGSFSSFDFVMDGTTILQILSSGTSFSLVSGNQSLSFTGSLPSDFQGIYDLLEGLGALGSADFDLLTDEEFGDILTLLGGLDISAISLSSSGDEYFGLGFDADSVSLTLGGLEFAANGTFDFDSLGDFLNFARNLLQTQGDTPLDLSAVPELGLTSLTVTGADGTELFTLVGQGDIDTEDDLELNTVTMLGTSGQDWDINLGDVTGSGAPVVVNLGDGRDELEVDAYDFLEILYDPERSAEDISLNGGEDDSFDQLDVRSYTSLYADYNIDLAKGIFQVAADPDDPFNTNSPFVTAEGDSASFDPENLKTIIDASIANFEDVDLHIYNGVVNVTGNDEDNWFTFYFAPSYFQIDGGDGDEDRLDVSNLFLDVEVSEGFFTQVDGISLDFFREFFTLEMAEDNWIDIFFNGEGNSVGRIRNIEEFEFLVTEDTSEIVSIADVLLPTDITGTTSGETLVGNALDNRVTGDAGDDILRGLEGSDTYIFGPGYGMDRIEEEGGTNDVIEFTHVGSIEDLEISRGAQSGSTWEGTLYIESASNEEVEVRNQFASHGRHLVETLRLSNGDEYALHTGTTGAGDHDILVGRSIVDFLKGNGGNDFLAAGANNDVVRGHAGDDILLGEAGNDQLVGSDGADSYHIFNGDGVDTIIEYDGVADLTSVDQLFLNDVASLDDLDIGRLTPTGSTWEGHMHFSMGANDGVIVLNHFASNGRYVVEELILSGGDTFKMTKETFGGAENDLLVGRSVVDYLKGNGGNDYMVAGGNDDVIFGHAGNDTLIGELGDDHLRGGDGADRYVLNAGDGDDLITEYDGVTDLASVDVIVFNDISDINDLTMSRVAESGATWQGSLLIETATDSVRVQHHFASNGRYKVEQIELSDGTLHNIDDFVIV